MRIGRTYGISAVALAVALMAGCGEQQGDSLLAEANQQQAAFQAFGPDGQPLPVTPAGQEIAGQGDGPAANDGRMQPVQLIDSEGFGQPVVVATLDVPAGWRAEGGVGWDNSTNCVTNQMKFRWRAVSQDGRQAFELMPGYSWQMPQTAVQMNPCPVERLGSARDFLSMVAQRMRPGAQVTGYRDRPDLGGQGQNGSRNEVGELRLSYNQNGQQTEEVLMAMVTFSGAGGLASYVSSLRAPAGQLNPGLSERIQKSMKANREYFAMISQRGTAAANAFAARQSSQIQQWHAGEMARINAKGASDRAAIRSQTARDVAAINSRTYANTVATNERINDNTRQGLMEQSTWVNPSTGQSFEGSIHGGGRVLQTDQNTVIRTDDPYYNPSGSVEMVPEG